MTAVSDIARLRADVLVVGGGLAALRAAVAAREAGARRVAVVVKGKAGQSGSSAITTAAYAVATDAEDGPELHARDTVRGGADIAEPELVRILCEGAAEELAYLERLGAAFKRDGARRQLSPSGDHSCPRVLTTLDDIGTDLTLPVRERARALGVEFVENAMAVELVRADGGGVCGAVCVGLRDGGVLLVEAAATVLATGGLGRLFPVTSNPRDVTGDGFALAAAAGAELRDMEFIQFYPWRCVDPFPNTRVSLQPSTWVMGGRLYNAAGERFMAAFNPNGAEATTRDVAARGIFAQVRQGQGVGAGVRADLSALTTEDLARSNPKVARHLARMGIDHRTYAFVVAPEAHYMMGGVRVDVHGASTVPGLFAVGEVAGGIHGANRINSNAMPEAMVFGARAGTAATEASAAPAPGAARVLDTAAQRWVQHLAARDGAAPDAEAATRMLRERAWGWLGIIRNGPAMRAGLEELRAMRAVVMDGPMPDGLPALRARLEFSMLCDTAELCLVAALARRESRGAHFRDDMPFRDDAHWHRSIFLRRGSGGDLSTIQREAA